MNTLRLFRLELRRLLHCRMTWLAVVFSLILYLAGYSLYQMLGYTTMAVLYLANPIALCTLGSTIIFSALALYELNRTHKYHMEAITNSIVSPLTLILVLTAGLITCVLLTALLGFILFLPYTYQKLDLVFSFSDYFMCWFLIFFPAPVFGVLLAVSFYLITQRTDVSILAIIVFLIFSRSGAQKEQCWWQWSLPIFPALSDDFSNALVFRVAMYNRSIWVCILGGCYMICLLCLRRYKKNLLHSIMWEIRKPITVVLGLCLFFLGGTLWHFQPFFDSSPADWIPAFQTHPDHILSDVFLTGTELTTDITETTFGTISGNVVYHIENTSGQPQELYFHLASGYSIQSATINDIPITMTEDPSDLIARRDWICTLPADPEITLKLTFHGYPKIWNQQSSLLSYTMITPTYINLLSTNLLPVPQLETKSPKTPFHATITLPANLTPVTTGYAAELISENNNNTKTWVASDSGVASISLCAADYVKADLKVSGSYIPIEFYYSSKHQKQLEEINAISTIEAAVAYCTDHYGPRSFIKEKPFKIIQGTEFMFGGFAASNISSTLEESFTVKNLQDTNKGATGAEVLAHEIIHQWWGLGIMVEDQENLYWTSEGLTTYSTYRLMEELYGEEYAKQYYLDKWDSAMTNAKNNFYTRHPEYLELLPENYAAAIQSELNSVYLYDGTAQLIKRAEELIGGRKNMDSVLSKLYLEGGVTPSHITFDDFLHVCGLTKEDLNYE